MLRLRLLCPVSPLTEAGRVLLCIAASAFAALLLVAWTVVPVDDAAPVSPLTSASAAR